MTAETQPQAKTPQPVRLADYRPPDYLVDQVELRLPPGAGGDRGPRRAS